MIGLDAYGSITNVSSNPDNVTVAQLEEARATEVKHYKDTVSKYGKPVLFSEFGICSLHHNSIYAKPYYGNCISPVISQGDYAEDSVQEKYYEATFRAVFSLPATVIAGGFAWKWTTDPAEGGVDNSNFTPHGKGAAGVMRQYWGGGGGSNVNEHIGEVTAV